MEALNQVVIAKDLDWISDSDYDELRSYIEPLSGAIGALRKSILNKAEFNTQNK
jgi:phytoene/squalene synthetase